MPGEFVRVASRNEIQEGKMKEVTVDANKIMLANVGGEFFAMGNSCTHMGGPLARGRLEGHVVTCPWHGSQFDVRTGAVVRSPAEKPQPCYEVRVEGEHILLKTT